MPKCNFYRITYKFIWRVQKLFKKKCRNNCNSVFGGKDYLVIIVRMKFQILGLMCIHEYFLLWVYSVIYFIEDYFYFDTEICKRLKTLSCNNCKNEISDIRSYMYV